MTPSSARVIGRGDGCFLFARLEEVMLTEVSTFLARTFLYQHTFVSKTSHLLDPQILRVQRRFKSKHTKGELT